MRTRTNLGQFDRNPRRSRGVAAVEFAITAPIILLLMLATAEIGRALVHYDRLSYSVRNSARYVSENAIVGSTGVVEIPQPVNDAAKYLAVYGNAQGEGDPVLPLFEIDTVTVADAGNENISVAADYVYKPMLLGGLPTFGLGDGNLSTLFQMRIVVTMKAIS